MATAPYTTRDAPATNILDLVRYLSSHDDGHCFYRGQVRHYDKPLLPSAFRLMLRDTPVVHVEHPSGEQSLRGIGRRFIGNFVWDREDYEQQAAARLLGSAVEGWTPPPAPETGAPRDADAYYRSHFHQTRGVYAGPPWTPLDELARGTLSNVEFNGLSARLGCRGAVRSILARRFPSLASTGEFADSFIDNYHRHVACTDLLINAFGYVIGSLISQHYGFYSGLLDATSSLEVAAFFATHAAPGYKLVPGDSQGQLGVIYRFQDLAPELTTKAAFELDYYTVPGTLPAHALLEQLEADVSLEESLRSLRQCSQIRTCVGAYDRRYDLLKLPRGVTARSRVGRQKAVVIVPDEVQKGVPTYTVHPVTGLPAISPNSTWTCQQSIEDCHWRPGVECFYFRHTGVDATPGLSALHLWPNDDDPFLLMIAYLFASGLSFYMHPGFIMPQRLDLIDPGHGDVPTGKLNGLAAEYMSRCGESALSESLAPVFPGNDKILFYVFKAGALSYRAHVTGDAVAAEEALRHCQVARDFDKTSVALISLQVLVNEALGRRERIPALMDEAVSILVKEGGGSKWWEESGYGSAMEMFGARWMLPLYQRRFSRDFAFYFYELYQSA